MDASEAIPGWVVYSSGISQSLDGRFKLKIPSSPSRVCLRDFQTGSSDMPHRRQRTANTPGLRVSYSLRARFDKLISGIGASESRTKPHELPASLKTPSRTTRKRLSRPSRLLTRSQRRSKPSKRIQISRPEAARPKGFVCVAVRQPDLVESKQNPSHLQPRRRHARKNMLLLPKGLQTSLLKQR